MPASMARSGTPCLSHQRTSASASAVCRGVGAAAADSTTPSMPSRRSPQDRPRAPATGVTQLIEETFLSYNAGRLREACRLYATKMLADDTTVGLSLSGALTPAGLGASCLVPLVEAGFLDWVVSTGANLYHDTHFALGMDLHQARPGLDDLELRAHQIIRIYDIVFDYENLLGTDRFYRKLCRGDAFQKTMGTAQLHYPAGKYVPA